MRPREALHQMQEVGRHAIKLPVSKGVLPGLRFACIAFVYS
jgi:hypothetical protein